MSGSPSSPETGDSLRLEALARAWHALSHHAQDGAPFGGPSCACETVAPRLVQILAWFDPATVREPVGLGAVVTNPLTGGVWVRAGHPDLPWRGGGNPAPQTWADPASENWFMWDDLPRPLQVETTGWMPVMKDASTNSDSGA